MIYLVDDDKSIRRAFELFLKSAGMEYQSFESAGDFLSACKPGLQDVLILDLNLPGMSGCDLLENFEKEGLQVPVVIVTAFDDPASRERCKRYGVKAFLRKPVDGEALIDIIRGV